MGSSRLVPVPDAFNMTFSDIRIYQATDACCLFCPRQGFCAAQKDLYFYFFVKHTSRKSVSVLVGTSLKFRASIDILARDLSTDPPPLPPPANQRNTSLKSAMEALPGWFSVCN